MVIDGQKTKKRNNSFGHFTNENGESDYDVQEVNDESALTLAWETAKFSHFQTWLTNVCIEFIDNVSRMIDIDSDSKLPVLEYVQAIQLADHDQAQINVHQVDIFLHAIGKSRPVNDF